MDFDDDEHIELLADIALMYYEEGLTQEEIAGRTQFSRSHISRLLAEAQKRGVVSIRVHHPLARNHSLEAKLQEVFGLKDVRVCQNRSEPYEDMVERIGGLAARLVAQHIHENITIGLSWGYALTEVVSAFHPVHCPGSSVVQVIGTVGSVDPVTDGPGLVRRFASLLDARAYTLAAPWFIDNKLVRDALLEDRRLRETLAMAEHLDIAIVGIGTIEPELSSIVRAGYIMPEQARYLGSIGIVGDVCGEQFDIHGNLMEIPLAGYVFGIDVGLLREVPLVIGVAGGPKKADAILGGLRSGLVNVLVTDESAAVAILDKNSRSG